MKVYIESGESKAIVDLEHYEVHFNTDGPWQDQLRVLKMAEALLKTNADGATEPKGVHIYRN